MNVLPVYPRCTGINYHVADGLRGRHHPDTGELIDWDMPANGRSDGVTIRFFLKRKTFAE